MVSLMKRKLYIASLILLGFIIVLEVYLRFYWGFCDTVLVREDPDMEYIAQPNQNRFRFRKHIRYNEYSMRNDKVKESDKLRILGFGDSVINGGTLTDQDSLATTIIEQKLTKEYGEDVRCFNISYGSWGPDNCYAYLEKYGDFNADLIFMVVSSHDAHDNMNFSKIVDIHSSFPSKQYFSAGYELFDRYLIPRIKKSPEVQSDPIIKGEIFNPGFSAFFNYTQEKNIPFFIYLHPDKAEVSKNSYDSQGELIIRFCAENNIPLIQGISNETEQMFRDKIHLNEHGQKELAKILLPEIRKYLNR